MSNNINLTTLSLHYNQITNVDLSNNIKLKDLSIETGGCSLSSNICYPKLQELDISNNVKLKNIEISGGQFVNLDVSENTSLTSLDVRYNQLTGLDVSKNTALTKLFVYNNQLASLDVSKNVALTYLEVTDNQLTELDASGVMALTNLSVNNNQLSSLDVSKNTALTYLSVYNNQLKELDTSGATALTKLFVYNNQLASLDVSENVALTYLEVTDNQLTELDASGVMALTNLSVNNNQLSSFDVSKNTALINLSVYNNQLSSLDVSKNTALTYLSVSRNPYAKEYYVYKNLNGVQMENPVKIPRHLDWSEPVWESDDVEIAVVDDDGLVKFLKVGTVKIEGSGNIKYTVTNTINVVEITSDKYKIDEDNNYILVGNDNDMDVIKSNIKKSNEDISVDIDMDKYKLYVKHGDEILKEFDIIGLSSRDYDLSKEYIYVKDGKLDLELINNRNCDKFIEDNKLVIKHGDTVLYEYKLISISSEDYDIKDYIYIGTGSKVDIDKINVINGDISLGDNKVIIKYGDEIVDEIDVVSISSNIYDLDNDYIFIGNKIDLSKIKCINCTTYIDDTLLVIKYNNKFNVYTYKLLSFNVRDYNMRGKNIVVLEEVSYSDFISKVDVSDGITYKIYNGEEVVTNGNISVGMEVKIYYNDDLVGTYMITDKDEYVDINNLDVDEDNKVINNISIGNSIDSIISNINTSGNIKVYNKDNELIEDNSKNIGTGWKIKIELTDSVEEYVISVKGDITGDGISNINDVIKVAKYLTNKDEIVGMEYMNAADVTNDVKVNINDVIRLSKTLVSGNR